MIISHEVETELQKNTAHLQINGKIFEIPIFERHELQKDLPKNFSVEIPQKLFRGSWPIEKLLGLESLEIEKIVSLYSSNDEKELAMLPILTSKVAMMGLDHVVIDIQNNLNLFDAAVNNYDGKTKTYVHCQAGANRTGLFCLTANIREKFMQAQPFTETDLIDALTKMLQSGYDWDQEKYIKNLNEIINLCIQRGFLTLDLFR